MKTLLTLSTLLLFSAGAGAQTTDPAEKSGAAGSSPTPSRPVGTNGTGETSSINGNAAYDPRPADITPDYRLVPGDKIRVEVYKDSQLSQSVQVRPDGKITLPLADDIPAAGKTPTELRDTIAKALEGYIANPTVTVIVQETTPPVIYVMGEVNRSGPQPLMRRMDVVQALSAAGGFKDFADTKDIKIRRGSKIIEFNYNDAVKGKTPPVYLQPGDTVIVP